MSPTPVHEHIPALLVLDGELTISNAVVLRRRLLDALTGPIEVDLSGVTHVDGAGLQLLIMLAREARLRGLTITMHSPSRAVQAAFELVRLCDALAQPAEQAA